MWAVHGGGFYHPVKFNVSPSQLPGNLHWFYWESYSTWLSGFALFTVSYLWSASSYLIDKSLMDWPPATAIAVALSFLLLFWILYDRICCSFGQRRHGDAIVGALVCAVTILPTYNDAASVDLSKISPAVAALKALVHREPTKELLDVHGNVTRPRRHAARELARR